MLQYYPFEDAVSDRLGDSSQIEPVPVVIRELRRYETDETRLAIESLRSSRSCKTVGT
jgi:hypothetical protein